MSETKKKTGLELLREPFPANQISKLPKESRAQIDERKADRNAGINCPVCGSWHHKRAVHLDYVGHAALTDRLLDVDRAWSWEPLSLDERGLPALDKDGGMWIKLTVCSVTRLGYGDAQGKTGGDAMKERIGDALRNAAMRFGAALDLWHKGDLHADQDESEAPAGKDSQRAAKVAPPKMDDNELDACVIAMQDCDDLDALKGIFGAAYKRADKQQQSILKPAYDAQKAKLEQLTKKAA